MYNVRLFILAMALPAAGAFTIQRSFAAAHARASTGNKPQQYVTVVHSSTARSLNAEHDPSQLDLEEDQDRVRESKTNMKSSTTSPAESMPWGSRQTWALRDNLSKYLIDIPQLPYDVKGEDEQKTTYVLWQALARDAIELTGYDTAFLREKYPLIHENDKDSDDDDEVDTKKKDSYVIPRYTPQSLPLLDQFEFETNGGVSGKISGLNGIADNTSVQTSPLAHVQLTVPRGYVLTEDGTAAYELGIPLNGQSGYSLDISKMGGSLELNQDMLTNTVQSGMETTKRVGSAVVETMGDKETTDLLVNLGATTAVLLASATAMNMLSHHMTVNVFWV